LHAIGTPLLSDDWQSPFNKNELPTDTRSEAVLISCTNAIIIGILIFYVFCAVYYSLKQDVLTIRNHHPRGNNAGYMLVQISTEYKKNGIIKQSKIRDLVVNIEVNGEGNVVMASSRRTVEFTVTVAPLMVEAVDQRQV
jgi:hypothetical protein